ncbi:MAG TPA: hypothetical protein VF131_13240 [Blastocatellia bacterium]|nr:hypothetical protein [Blastocatellia bacterium]
MKSYIQIQVPGITLAAYRGAAPGPVGVECSKRQMGRLPCPVGVDTWNGSVNGLLEETIPGGGLTLELDNKNREWKIRPPALRHWQYYLPATGGKWARSGDEITIFDAVNKKILFSLGQANGLRGRASYDLSPTGRYEHHTEWKRVPKLLPVSSRSPIWYGLAVADSNRGGGPRSASAVVISDDRWFTFSMPQPAAQSFRGYSWNAAFVLLTGYLDKGDLVGNAGAGVDYELSLGASWREQAGALNPLVAGQSGGFIDFALKHSELLRSLGMAALEGTCLDYDERHVIIGDLAGEGINAGIYAYTGECVQG